MKQYDSMDLGCFITVDIITLLEKDKALARLFRAFPAT